MDSLIVRKYWLSDWPVGASTTRFPAPLMSAIGDVGAFFARETAAADQLVEPTITLPRVIRASDVPATSGSVER